MKERCVLQVTNYSSNYAGNFIPLLVRLEKAMAKIGLRQVYVFPETARAHKWSAALEAGGHQVVYLPVALDVLWSWRASVSVTAISALVALAEQENCAILHTHFNALDVAAWLALHWRPRSRSLPRLIWHCHSGRGAAVRGPLRILKDTIKLKGMARSVRTIAVSEAVKDELVKYGCPPSRIQVVCNGIELGRIHNSALSKEEARSMFGFATGEPIILAQGWDPLTKGVDILLKAFSRMNGRPARLVLIGAGRMEAMLDKWLSTSRPDWLTVIAPTEDLPKLYYAADVFVSASRREGFPYSVLEALAAGLPVVSTDIPALAWAREIPSVSFVKPEDAESMADQIVSTIGWPASTRQQRVKQSALIVREKFGADRWVESVTKCYMSLLGQT